MESETTMEVIPTDHDTTETMETSADSAHPTQGKRKAEIQDLEDSSEIVEGGTPSAGVNETSTGSETKNDDSNDEWEWGYDSFDDLSYVSPDEEWYSDDESNQKIRRYRKQCIGNKGFYVDDENFPEGDVLMGAIYPMADEELDRYCKVIGKTEREHMAEMAKQALQIHNERNETNVTFERVERINERWYRGYVKNYVTILAKESLDGPPVPYQVKVKRKVRGVDKPMLCRRAPDKIVTGWSP